ncbi:TolC family protein [Acidovorax sp. BoFeN1]|uniref:TolC family protein n=1 Tax=Acidovorax sp. BoFeN1 TaxID=1231053 RepID=UPI000E09CAAB|nr:TolC family protein [Acidovorax sp. BoFeN1]RDD94001.1 TolC family protein [Acidovorax sp. BoFeN1]
MTRLQPRSPLAMLRRTAAAVCLAWAGAAGLSVAMAQTPPALTLPPVLPPAETVMQVLSQLPQVRAASAGVPLAQARNQRLEAGPHDWVAKAGTNRRTERQGPSFSEADVALETGLRWPAKAAADRQLGATEIQLGELALADAWHEAARGLMAAWFDALRDMRTASVLQDQARLVTQQMASTERRVAAGEAATLERLAAQAEAARIDALAARAQGQLQVRLQTLERLYPGLPKPVDMAPTGSPAGTATSAAADFTAAEWASKILDDNHELKLAQAKAQQARQQAQRTALERHGDPTVGVRASRERGGQERVLGVYVSIPLGSAGRRADAQAALAQAEMAEQELAQKRVRIEAEAWRTASVLEQTRHTRVQLQRAQRQIERSAQLQARAYTLGESPLADLLLARRNALEAQLAADSAALDEMQSHARLLLDSHSLWRAPGAHGH